MPVKCIGLGGKEGGLRELSPLNILSGEGGGVSFSSPQKSYILKNLD